jgi:hypothetical protein
MKDVTDFTFALLDGMNANHGVGDIVSAEIDPETRVGIVIRRPFGCKEQKRKFRIEGGTLYFLGHQRKLRPFESAEVL